VSAQESQATLALFAKFLARSMGLHFTDERLCELEQKLTPAARDAGYRDLEQYLLWLMSAPLSRGQLEDLARVLTIGETYFLRDPKSYRVLEEQLIPELVARRRASDKSLRIWSAGCSSGEEPYTLAILLSRIIPDLSTWKISLLATDINPQALERGRQGIYSQWSFRNAPPWLMDYFTRCGDGRFQVVERIRSMVDFGYLNLADAEPFRPVLPAAGPLDIILCRNVMLYFEQAQIERTMARFQAALGDGGWLLVGPTEVDLSLIKGFSCLRFPGAFVLEKEAAGKDPARRGAHGALAEFRATACTAVATEPSAGHPARRAVSGIADAAGTPATTPSPAEALSPPAATASSPDEAQSSTAEAQSPAADGAEREPAAEDPCAEARNLYQSGCYQQAADSVRAVLDSLEQPAEALALGARAFANIGRFSEARDFCERAIAQDRLNAQNHYLLSIILEQQGELSAAAAALKNVLYIDQDYLLAYFALGNLSRQAGDVRDSERNFANALRLLERRDPHEVLPEAEGMTAGSLAQMIRGMTQGRSTHG
jgi:chemotaxis protein methyltransferase CheR